MSFDQDTEWLMTTVEIDDGSLAEKWFQAICDTYEANAEDWPAFRQAFVANAMQADTSFDDNFIEDFFQAAENDLSNPLAALKEMSAHGLDELLRTYPALLEQKRSALAQDEQAPDVATLWWVTDDQRAQLEGALGAAWQTAVVDTLDDKWPPWRGGTQDGLVGFVNDWMDTILAQAPQVSEAQDASTLWWVTDEQRERLEGALGAAWQATVVDTLDDSWPPWRGGTQDGLIGFVNDWMDTILARSPASSADLTGESADEAPAEETATSEGAGRFDWVSSDQTQLLENEIYPDGHWREQLGTQLDIRWGDGWEAQPAETKRDMLENIIGTLALTPMEDLSDEELEQISELVESLAEGGLERLEELVESDDSDEVDQLLEVGILEEEIDDEADEALSL